MVIPTVALLAVTLIAVVLQPDDAGPPRFRTARLATVDIPGRCDGGATRPFTPSTVDIEDVRTDLAIQPIARDGDDVPGVPPVSATHTVAFDAPGPKPGSERGLVRLNAHTWPNGAALGNEMLARFDVGDVLTLRNGDLKLCYRVTKRVEVDGYATYEPFYELDVPAEFAFIVCSGERLGPGNWNKRTIWFGEPIGDTAAKPTLQPVD
ncbi:MAG TPA: class F sortase [Aeromicrobium sp.]|nr:class F sortase [Aeromicrobium sp.]HKY58784.1 class F sortase [Aeromicrobium sp.]